MKYFFKVRYGYKPMDFVSIEAGPDLERAIYAKIEKIPVTLGNKFIDGSTIIRIEPDVHKYTGWNQTYEPKDAEDEAQIRRDVPKEIEKILSGHYDHVHLAMRRNDPSMIGTGEAIKEILMLKENGNS